MGDEMEGKRPVSMYTMFTGRLGKINLIFALYST